MGGREAGLSALLAVQLVAADDGHDDDFRTYSVEWDDPWTVTSLILLSLLVSLAAYRFLHQGCGLSLKRRMIP